MPSGVLTWRHRRLRLQSPGSFLHGGGRVDAFAIRDRLVTDYAEYVRSFITVKDRRMKEYVDDVLAGGTLWPEPLIQLNPAFEPGESLQDLVSDNALHAECERIFRIKTAADTIGVPMRLHRQCRSSGHRLFLESQSLHNTRRASKEGFLTRYSSEVLQFLRKLSAEDVQRAVRLYAEHLRSRRKDAG